MDYKLRMVKALAPALFIGNFEDKPEQKLYTTIFTPAHRWAVKKIFVFYE